MKAVEEGQVVFLLDIECSGMIFEAVRKDHNLVGGEKPIEAAGQALKASDSEPARSYDAVDLNEGVG